MSSIVEFVLGGSDILQISTVIAVAFSVITKIIIDYLSRKSAENRLLEAEKKAFQVTQDADIKELEGQISPRAGNRNFHRFDERIQPGDAIYVNRLVDVYSKQIEKYQTDTQSRASWSFIFAVLSMLAGLGFVVWGGAHLLINPGWEHVAGAAAIAGIGGAIGAYIAKTFLDVHRLSLSQLNHYFRQPVINAHVLTGQRLADEISEPAARQRAYEQLLAQVASLIRDDYKTGAVWAASSTPSGPAPPNGNDSA